jgi:hypothetical protein
MYSVPTQDWRKTEVIEGRLPLMKNPFSQSATSGRSLGAEVLSETGNQGKKSSPSSKWREGWGVCPGTMERGKELTLLRDLYQQC